MPSKRKCCRWAIEDGNQISKPFYLFLAIPQFITVIEVWKIGTRELRIGIRKWTNDLLVDLVTDVGLALQRNHILETRTCRDRDRRIRHTRIFVADVFDE